VVALADDVGIVLVIIELLILPTGQSVLEQVLTPLIVHNFNPSLQLVVTFVNSTVVADLVVGLI
jgi:hypothetical protein